MRFIGNVIEKLQRHPKRVVFPEGEEPRILQAARQFQALRLGAPILLGEPEKIKAVAEDLKIPLDGIRLINPATSEDLDNFANRLYRVRREKGLRPAEAREAMRYDGAMAKYEDAAVKTGQSLSFLNFGQALLITAGLVAVMVMAALGVQQGKLTVGDFVMVNAYMMQITQPLGFLGTVYREIRQSLIDMSDMFDLLDQPAEIIDRPDARALKVTGGEVVLDNVFFGYESARPILKGVTIRVGAGQSVAIVGPSGSGKSTIGRLLFRFYEVTGGSLKIDGQDVRDVTQDSLHAQIGVVPQDTVLFNDTVLYNIAYGRPTASPSEIEEAARAAKIHDFIVSLPEGYQTKVGERGLKLSGGEKQRVGIARTLLKNPPILLLDEATSALDTQTERDIQESLKAMGKGRTVITIAHRLSTIADADRIVVLEQGVIVEEGKHDDLLAHGGRYAAMWNRQSAEAEEADEEAA